MDTTLYCNFRILTELTGFSIRAHQIEEHRQGLGLSTSETGGSNSGRATDVYVFATDANDVLVNTDTLLRLFLTLIINTENSQTANA